MCRHDFKEGIKLNETIWIFGYGSYIPLYRIKKEEYIKVWGYFSGSIKEKSVIGYDEDVVTMAVEASSNALKNAGIDKDELSLIAVGSTSPPYSVKSIASEIAMALGVPLDISLLDFKESEKAGSTAFATGIDIIKSKGGYGLIIGSDSPLSSPSENLEHVQSAAAGALIIGKGEDGLAKIEGHKSSNVEHIADRFRKAGSKKVQDLDISSYSRYAYNNSIKNAAKAVMKELELDYDSFDIFYVQGHDTRQPTRVFREVDNNRIYTDIINKIGDSGASNMLLGLIGILHYKFSKYDRVLCLSYGSGAGSDAYSIIINKKQKQVANIPTINKYLERKEYISYDKYIKFKELIELT
ncbi:MAG: hydroxymethylglutaryl-CoA synthase [Candidatus Lokiarchaeota archaeon]|nr:hydroxymethylglutaryl-CoA synthase [Candidatus Lokiarchaeota archaeon]